MYYFRQRPVFGGMQLETGLNALPVFQDIIGVNQGSVHSGLLYFPFARLNAFVLHIYGGIGNAFQYVWLNNNLGCRILQRTTYGKAHLIAVNFTFYSYRPP